MTVSTTTGGAPLVVGLGGTLRANSSTERALRYCLVIGRTAGRADEVVLRPRTSTCRCTRRTNWNAHRRRSNWSARCATPTPSSSARPATTGRCPVSSRTHWTTSRISARIRASTSTTRRGAASAARTDGRRRSARWASCAASGMRCAPGRRRSGWRSTPPTRSGTPKAGSPTRGRAGPTRHAGHPGACLRPRRVGNGVIEIHRRRCWSTASSPAISKRDKAIRSSCCTAASSASARISAGSTTSPRWPRITGCWHSTCSASGGRPR